MKAEEEEREEDRVPGGFHSSPGGGVGNCRLATCFLHRPSSALFPTDGSRNGTVHSGKLVKLYAGAAGATGGSSS